MNPLTSFLAYLENEKHYANHTVVSYRRDILDFEQFLMNEELAANLV